MGEVAKAFFWFGVSVGWLLGWFSYIGLQRLEEWLTKRYTR